MMKAGERRIMFLKCLLITADPFRPWLSESNGDVWINEYANILVEKWPSFQTRFFMIYCKHNTCVQCLHCRSQNLPTQFQFCRLNQKIWQMKMHPIEIYGSLWLSDGSYIEVNLDWTCQNISKHIVLI